MTPHHCAPTGVHALVALIEDAELPGATQVWLVPSKRNHAQRDGAQPGGTVVPPTWQFPACACARAQRPEAALSQMLATHYQIQTQAHCMAPVTFTLDPPQPPSAATARSGYDLCLLYVVRLWSAPLPVSLPNSSLSGDRQSLTTPADTTSTPEVAQGRWVGLRQIMTVHLHPITAQLAPILRDCLLSGT